MKSYIWLTTGIVFSCVAIAQPTQAQITPDGTTATTVDSSGQISEINGGTTAGQNVFHSFEYFSIPTGNTARFINNNPMVENVIGRVTGPYPSEILGRLEAGGSASEFNLFLLNPNGIIFGPNASLNLNGSFVATTANAIGFGNQGYFSASEPQDPSLLTVNPSALLFSNITPAVIENRSRVPTVEPSPLYRTPAFGLQVPDGKSLVLAGGDILMDGGGLNAFGGRVELGGLAEPGSIGLNIDHRQVSLSFPENVGRSNVTLTKGALVDVSGTGNGNIAINAANINVFDESQIRSGVGLGLESSATAPSSISLNATEALTLKNRGVVLSAVGPFAVGNASNIEVNAQSLSLDDGSGISTISIGQGNAGNIVIDVSDALTLAGDSGINSVLIGGGSGKSGSIISKLDHFLYLLVRRYKRLRLE